MAKRLKRHTMTDEERVIWRAAYAAAYVHEFQENRTSLGWDHAAERTGAEVCIMIADQSVMELQYWREREDARVGVSFVLDDNEEGEEE